MAKSTMTSTSLLTPLRRITTGLMAALALAAAGSAMAAPVLGAQLYWQGGDVTIEVQGTSAGYLSELRLFNPNATSTFIAYNAPNGNPIGTTVTLTTAWLDLLYNTGDELKFGIFVTNTGNTFYLGNASRNADGVVHGAIDNTVRSGWLRVGFEDLAGGGDLDYDDNVFDFRGSVRTTAEVAEPSVLALMGLALAGAGWARRRSARA